MTKYDPELIATLSKLDFESIYDNHNKFIDNIREFKNCCT